MTSHLSQNFLTPEILQNLKIMFPSLDEETITEVLKSNVSFDGAISELLGMMK
jgi:hypothetical protein